MVLGFDVCPINSVQLSNHTGYKKFLGQVLTSKDMECLYDGLKENNIHCQFSHLLTGYMGDKSFLEKVGEIIHDLKQANPGLIYDLLQERQFWEQCGDLLNRENLRIHAV